MHAFAREPSVQRQIFQIAFAAPSRTTFTGTHLFGKMQSEPSRLQSCTSLLPQVFPAQCEPPVGSILCPHDVRASKSIAGTQQAVPLQLLLSSHVYGVPPPVTQSVICLQLAFEASRQHWRVASFVQKSLGAPGQLTSKPSCVEIGPHALPPPESGAASVVSVPPSLGRPSSVPLASVSWVPPSARGCSPGFRQTSCVQTRPVLQVLSPKHAPL